MKRLLACALTLAVLNTRANAQSAVVVTRDLPAQIGLTFIWAAIAAALFFLAFKAVDWATPGDLKQQLADGNTAMAVFVAGLCIASAIIISALVN
jgi:uncharacterized membrane protein YjfL (UPF0719 family)